MRLEKKFNEKPIPAVLEIDGIGKELEANRTILDTSSSSSVLTNGSVTDHMQKGIQNMLILQSCPPSSTVGQQSGGSSSAVDDPTQKSKQLQQRWISRGSSLQLGTLGGEKGMLETRVHV